MAESANIARHLPLMAARQPDRPAVKIPRGRSAGGDIDYLTLSYAAMEREVAAWRAKLEGRGVQPGDRVLVMVRQGLPLIASAFALFQLGAVPVIIDPGMGRRNFLACVAHTRPRVLLGLPVAQLLSRIFRRPFTSVGVRIWVPGSPTARLADPARPASPHQSPAALPTAGSSLAAILFTSGSTGAPKGVRYEHGMFDAQVRHVRETYGIEPGEVDLPLLPIFALFGPALGLTTIVPEIDPSHPAAADPAKLVQAIRQEKVTNSFGSPTLWRKIFDHCRATGTTLPGLRRVLCAGAAVPLSLYADAREFLPAGELHSPYGATEALPVTTTRGAEVLDPANQAAAALRGVCVGRPIAGVDVRLIAIRDEPIAQLADTAPVSAGEVGEIIVRGPAVTREYDQAPDATRRSKIADGDTLWHRMGDCGLFDASGRLWFCGRAAERVVTPAGTLFTEQCEQVFRTAFPHLRFALIGTGPAGNRVPALVVEQEESAARATPGFLPALRRTARLQPHTAAIRRFYFHPHFPVDVRHNAKIHRLALARWAETARPVDIPDPA